MSVYKGKKLDLIVRFFFINEDNGKENILPEDSDFAINSKSYFMIEENEIWESCRYCNEDAIMYINSIRTCGCAKCNKLAESLIIPNDDKELPF